MSTRDATPMLEMLEPRLMFSANALIITDSTLASAFDPVADWYTRKGHQATVVDVANIYTSYSGADNQAKIRNCITDYRDNHGVGYVLLGGDNTIVPDRDAYVSANGYTESAMPTDLYYASLSGTWDSDGDGIYGEAGQDTDVALTYDVIVSRYPVRSAQHVSDLLAKVQAYETNPATSGWAKEYLFAGDLLWSNYGAGTYNGRTYDHTASDAEIKSWFAYDTYIDAYQSGESVDWIFDTDTSWDTSTHGDNELNQDNLLAAMQNNYQFMHMATHGNTNIWGLESGYWSSYSIEGMTSDDTFNVPIVSTMACITGAFDSAESSLSEAFLRSPYTGTVVYMGCSRYGWGADSATYLGPSIRYAFQYYKELLNNGKTLAGDAFKASKEAWASHASNNNSDRWIQFGLNLQGDPLVQMYSENPSAISPTYDASVFAGAQSYSVSGLAQGAQVCLWQEASGLYEVGTADATGTFTTSITPDPGTVKLTVVQANAPVYTADVEVVDTVIVDNADANFSTTGTWYNSSATDAYNSGSVCSGETGATATWSFTLPETGLYRVSAWYAAATDSGSLNRDSMADYTVTHANGTNRLTLDQDSGSGAWVTLGDYQFNSGSNSVTLTHDSEDWRMTSADAIKVAPLESGSVELVVDNRDSGFETTGTWLNSAAADAYNLGSVCSAADGATATFSATLPESGTYAVYARWASTNPDSSGINRDSKADYSITHKYGTNKVTVDQDDNSGTWVLLGNYTFDAGSASVVLSHDGEDWRTTSADAVKFAKISDEDVTLVVDDRDSGFSTTGTWLKSSAVDAHNNGSICSAGNGAEATWTATLPATGSYAVYARWASTNPDSSGINRDSKADYSITHKYGTNKITVDQDDNSGTWVLLGNYTFDAGNASVVLTHDSEDWRTTSADAVKFVKIADEPITVVVDDRDTGFSTIGTFYSSAAIDAYNAGSVCTVDNGGQATWTANLPVSGSYAVYAWWSATNPDSSSIDRDSMADYTLTHKYGSNKITVDQDNNAGQWVHLGNFTFDAGNASVKLTHELEDWRFTSMDAVKWVKVTDQIELVVDERDSGFSSTGTWGRSAATDSHNYSSIISVEDNATATWTANLPEAGMYEIFVQYTNRNPDASTANRDSKADYTVTHSYGTARVTLDQDTGGGQWNSIGTYHFAGGDRSVTLTVDGEDWRHSVADAVKFVKIDAGSDDVIVDNADDGFSTTGTWLNSSATDTYGDGCKVASENGATATWSATLHQRGTYEVYGWWARDNGDGSYANRDSKADYTINHALGTSNVEVDQDVDAGGWVLLGTYQFDAGTASVTLTVDAEDWRMTVADAVRFKKITDVVDVVTDNSDPRFENWGTWLSSSAVDAYGAGSIVASEDGAGARWFGKLDQAGSYDVYVWYSAENPDGTFADRDSQADYIVKHASGWSTVQVDQDNNSGQWVKLGTWNLNSGLNNVRVGPDGDDWRMTVADAVRWVRVGAATQTTGPAETTETDVVTTETSVVTATEPPSEPAEDTTVQVTGAAEIEQELTASRTTTRTSAPRTHAQPRITAGEDVVDVLAGDLPAPRPAGAFDLAGPDLAQPHNVDILAQARSDQGPRDDVIEQPIAPVDLLGELLEEDLGELPFSQAA